MSSLIIYNLPNTITKMDLMKTFSQKGNVTNIQLIFDVENEYCYFALIMFQTEEEAKTAQKHFNKTYLCASRIQIDRCREIVDNEVVKSIVEHPEDTKQITQINKEITRSNENKEPTCMASNLANVPRENKSSATNETDKGIYFTQPRDELICQKELKLKSCSDMTKLNDQEFCTNVASILNKITCDNINTSIDRFRALPINTVERLEKTVDFVFEKAIEEQCFAPLYATLCSAMLSVQASSGEGGNKRTFKKLIISKCQSVFELDKAQEMDSVKRLSEINSCKDPKKKKVLRLEFEENEKISHERSVGNCRFIGELFLQKILTPNIMLYCIVNLVTKHVEESLECLCNLLKIVGKELEQSYNLNDTFDKLKHLTSKGMDSKIPLRIRIMIQDVIDLRRNKWIPRRNCNQLR